MRSKPIMFSATMYKQINNCEKVKHVLIFFLSLFCCILMTLFSELFFSAVVLLYLLYFMIGFCSSFVQLVLCFSFYYSFLECYCCRCSCCKTFFVCFFLSSSCFAVLVCLHTYGTADLIWPDRGKTENGIV